MDNPGADPLRYDAANDHPAEVGGMMHYYMPEGARVLDVGCGTGSVTIVANRGKSNSVVGLEPDPTRCARARSRGFEVFEGTLTAEFADEHGPFDVVVFADVLEHMIDPEEALILAIRALRPGGLILASVPNVAHWSVRLMLLFGKFDYEDVGIMDATHLRWFTAKSFRQLITKAGLEVVTFRQTAGVDLGVNHKATFGLVPPYILRPFIRLLVRLFPRLIGCQHFVVARRPITV